jgi:hypothetical protein
VWGLQTAVKDEAGMLKNLHGRFQNPHAQIRRMGHPATAGTI